MTVLLDSDVLIDCLRATAAARAWSASERADELLVPGIVAMELLAGCRNRAEQRRVLAFLAQFPVVWPTPDEGAAALDLFVRYGLSDGIGILDCAVAAMALQRDARLLSFNLRHFRAIDGLAVDEPYRRSV